MDAIKTVSRVLKTPQQIKQEKQWNKIYSTYMKLVATGARKEACTLKVMDTFNIGSRATVYRILQKGQQ